MKRLIVSLAVVVVTGGAAVNATSFTQLGDKIPAPYIGPGIPSKAQAEANKLDHKTVNLTENYPYEYVSKTAAQDAAAIKQVLVQKNVLSATEVKDFSFDNMKILDYAFTYNLSFTVKNPNGQTASGVFDVYLNSAPKKVKAKTIGPSQPSKTAQDIANKLSNKTIKLDPGFWGTKNLINYPQQLRAAIVQQGLLTEDEAQYVFGADQIIQETIAYAHLKFYCEKKWSNCYC